MPHGYGWSMYGWGWAMMLFMAFFWLLFLAGVAFLIRWAYERSTPGRLAPSGGPESALDILQKRYARGEITAEQYREMKRELEAGPERTP